MKSILGLWFLFFSTLYLYANPIENSGMSEELLSHINEDRAELTELIDSGACKEAIDLSQHGLLILKEEYPNEKNIKVAKSMYYGMMHKVYSNKNGMCEEQKNDKLALSNLILYTHTGNKNYDLLGDVYFFGKYNSKVDMGQALKYYMKEYSNNNLKRGSYLYNTAQIFIKMDRDDKATVFLQKNFDCQMSQKLLKEIGKEAKECTPDKKDKS